MEQANAAQIAARNIKTAKGRRGGLKPVQSNPGAQQSMSFGAPASGQGGLFGGSIPSTGSFDFSAPSSGLSFPPAPAFGGTNIFGAPSSSASDNDNEAGIGGDEDRRKKSFRGGPGAATSTSQSTLFGQSQPSNPFASANGQASNPFSFSQPTSQPSSPGLGGFNSVPAQSQPATSIFSFGGTPSQPVSPGPSNVFSSAPSQQASSSFTFGQTASQPAQQPTSTFSFGSPAPSATQDKPVNNPFSFLNSASAPPATQEKPVNDLFGFSQTATSASPATQDKPSTGLFGFSPNSTSTTQGPANPSAPNLFTSLQSSTQQAPPSKPGPANGFSRTDFGQFKPSSSGFNFGSTVAAEKSSTNMFGTSQPPQSTQTTSSANIFSNLKPASAPSTNLFGGQQEPKPAETSSSPSGTQTQQIRTTSNLFANANQAPANANPFDEPVTTTPSSSYLFSNNNKPADSTINLFGSLKPASTNSQSESSIATSTSNLFGGLTATSTNNLFGNLNKPVDEPIPEPKVNGTGHETTGENTTSSLFDKPPSANVFGKASSLFSAPPLQTETTKAGSDSLFSFGASSAQPNGKSPSFVFGSTQPSAPAAQPSDKTSTSLMKPMDVPSTASQPPPNGMFPNLAPPTPTKSNDATSKTLTSTALTTTTDSTSKALVNGNATEEFDYASLYADMDAASALSDEQLTPLVPRSFSDSQKVEFFTAYRLRSLNKAVEEAFSSIMFNVGISNLISYYNEKKVEILDRSSLPYPGSKRRTVEDEDYENGNRPKRSRSDAAPGSNVSQPQSAPPISKPNQPSDDQDQENENPNKGSRQDAPPKSNIFQFQPPSQTPRGPESTDQGRDQPQPHLNGHTPKAPSFAPAPSSPSADSLKPSPTKGKRKAEVQLTKDDHERDEYEERRLKNPRPQSDSNGKSEGSNTANLFKSIVDTPSQGRKKIATPRGFKQQSSNDSPRANPFSILPAPKSPTKPAASEVTTNMFARTPSSDGTSKVSSSTPAYNANPFQPKPAPDGVSKTATDKPNPTVLQKPTFNMSGANLVADFAKESQRKRMEKAKAEDKDSDEDSDEWEANWEAEEMKRKKEFAELSKGKAGFVFGGNASSTASSTSGSIPESPAAATGSQSATVSTLFGQPVQSSGNSLFGSRASTPGALGSSTGSVLDGHTPGQPIIGNKFFSFSDTGSGADSGQADDDSSGPSDGEEDSENKDPNYDPGEDSGSGPGTPVEETGAGIASAKKKESTTPFSFGPSTLGSGLGGGSKSGTSSPGRSLFDRVTRDANGKSLRQIPTENQENTPPAATPPPANTNTSSIFAHLNNTPVAGTNTSSLFAGLNKSSPPAANTTTLFGTPNNTSATPTNQTWNPNTPILFGNTTPTSSVGSNNPIVSITEATPTKAPTFNLFGNLNNSGSTPKAPSFGPGLFGSNPNAPSSSGSTPGVGFSFGGQPSATSSLFPSAIASTTTSRATSPGNTTDGDSATGDPDEEEKHEQIDLTSGGPGTEDEEVIYEVRAKATKFIPKNSETPSTWKAMGLGPLRVLKHKETAATRLVLRADPSGVIVLNKALLAKVEYKADKKTVKFLAASDNGTGLETWIIQVKTAEMAEALAGMMESNKPSE